MLLQFLGGTSQKTTLYNKEGGWGVKANTEKCRKFIQFCGVRLKPRWLRSTIPRLEHIELSSGQDLRWSMLLIAFWTMQFSIFEGKSLPV